MVKEKIINNGGLAVILDDEIEKNVNDYSAPQRILPRLKEILVD